MQVTFGASSFMSNKIRRIVSLKEYSYKGHTLSQIERPYRLISFWFALSFCAADDEQNKI